MVKEISREELRAGMDRAADFSLVEALSRRNYEMSHLPGGAILRSEEVALKGPAPLAAALLERLAFESFVGRSPH